MQSNHTIYKPQNYVLQPNEPTLPSNHNIWHKYPFKYIHTWLNVLQSLRTLIHFRPKQPLIKTIYNKYSHQSLAIIFNGQNQDKAALKALNYHIPLMQVCLTDDSFEEQLLRQRILLCFEISHFINQNFIFYGSWQQHPETSQSLGKSTILFRKGNSVYGSIEVADIAQVTDQQLQTNLLKARDTFYKMDIKKQDTTQQSTEKINDQQQQKWINYEYKYSQEQFNELYCEGSQQWDRSVEEETFLLKLQCQLQHANSHQF